MLKHILLIKVKKQEDIKEAVEALENMKGKVEGLLDLEVGVDVTHKENSYDIALTTTHLCRKDLDAYQNNPLHVSVKQLIAKIKLSSVAVDYEK